jgi:hypothetical protein
MAGRALPDITYLRPTVLRAVLYRRPSCIWRCSCTRSPTGSPTQRVKRDPPRHSACLLYGHHIFSLTALFRNSTFLPGFCPELQYATRSLRIGRGSKSTEEVRIEVVRARRQGWVSVFVEGCSTGDSSAGSFSSQRDYGKGCLILA